jgi:hypothetical protein
MGGAVEAEILIGDHTALGTARIIQETCNQKQNNMKIHADYITGHILGPYVKEILMAKTFNHKQVVLLKAAVTIKALATLVDATIMVLGTNIKTNTRLLRLNLVPTIK